MKEKIVATREYREKMLADPYRPGYHFVVPDDNGMPGDSNGAFFADGRYHLMYLYHNSGTDGFHWGHMSSIDLLHWRHHPDALTIDSGDKGCFSGGAFVDEDGTAYLTFWKFAATEPAKDHSGIAMAYAKPPYEVWTRMEPIAIDATEWGILDLEIDGTTEHIGCADPSNIWKIGDTYYMQTGNLCVLNKYGREENSPEKYQGGWTELFRSKDLKHWEYVHRFYENTVTGEDWPDRTEDDMCPSFLPLYDAKENGNPTGKYLQLFIAHNKGCQYFVGSLNEEKFLPEVHGRMSWKDSTYFAPEALIDDRNRQIVWTWLRDNPQNDFEKYAWTGVFGFPRVLWWEDGDLRMAPAQELDRLQYNHQNFTGWKTEHLPVKNGTSFRLRATWKNTGTLMGFRVRMDDTTGEFTDILVDPEAGQLVMDTRNSGCDGWKIREEAPLVLPENATIELDLFVDQSVVEVYVNERQAICRRVYPTNPARATGVKILGEPGRIEKLDAWEIMPSNMY